MIDLRSDTVTRPSEAMRAAMARAEVGDDVFGDDPTVNALQQKSAALLGKEAALLMPSGTMANLVALLAQSQPGDTVILSRDAHPFQYEGGNLAAFGGLLTRPISGVQGKFTPAQLRDELVLIDDPHFSRTTLAAIENTTNRGGGAVYRPDEVDALSVVTREFGLRLHCDGARIFNAALAAECSVADLARGCDSVSFCLSKGLGCPAGSLLAGSDALIHRATRLRKMLGGGMRQVGILAAAGLYALDHHVADLAEDHRRAREFRQALESAGAEFLLPSPTNILFLRVAESFAVAAALAAADVFVLPHGNDAIRAVFHRDISDAQLAEAIAAFLAVVAV